LLNDRDADELAKEDVDVKEVQPADKRVASKGNLTQAIRLATVDNFQGDEAKSV
jgi:superfamily I DNA and/or RNA helicase